MTDSDKDMEATVSRTVTSFRFRSRNGMKEQENDEQVSDRR